jgi:hypothetical protein
MYKVITKTGVTFFNVSSFDKWDLNEEFIVLKHNIGRVSIIRFDDIESIEQVTDQPDK